MRWKKGIGGEAVAIVAAALLFSGCGDVSSSPTELSEGGGDGSSGTGLSSTYTMPSELGVGDIMPIEFADSSTVSVSFEGVSSGANFILLLGSSQESGSGATIQMTTNIAADDTIAKAMGALPEAETSEDDAFGPQEIMHAWLRASEDALQYTEDVTSGVGSGTRFKASTVKALGMGGTEEFRVLASLSSTSSYVTVTGEVHCVGTNVVFYVDQDVPDSALPDSDVSTLCAEFDRIAAEEKSLLGDISDVDSDGKLQVLMTKQINRLGAMGGGIITGYFYAGDLYDRSSSNPVSNEREIIYTMVPDPEGDYGTAISNAFAMSNLLPAVLPHELQHAISYNQHVLVAGGSPEENWLNEGMSHLIEDLMGYNVENPSRYAMYLASPSTYGLVTQSSPNLLERGAAYLFLRYLYEQSSDGSAFLRALEASSSRGVDNLESSFGGPSNFDEFSEFVARWSLALAMTDRGITSDGRYIYRSRVRNAQSGNWEGVCLECNAEDGRGTSLDGVYLNSYYGTHSPSIDSSGLTFYNITTFPSRMNLASSGAGQTFGVLIRTE